MFSKVFNPFLYFNLKNKLKNGILYQSSYLKNYTSKYIKIENYIMKKLFNSFLDFNNEYFFRFARRDYLIYEKISNNVDFEEPEFVFKHDFFFIDVDKEFFLKTIAKNLFLLEVDDKQTLFLKKSSLIEDFQPYIKGELNNFYILSLDLLKDFSIADLRSALGSFSNGIALFKSLVVGEKEEKEQFSKYFTFDKLLVKINTYRDIILNENIKITRKELVNYPYYAILGSAGSGKSFFLFHIILNVILSRDFKKVIIFDTQGLFGEYVKKLKQNHYERFLKTKEIYGIYKITENDIYLTEIEMYNLLNFLLEKENLISEKEKKEKIKLDIKDKTKEEILKELKEEKDKYESKRDYKELRRLHFLEELINFLEKIKIREFSIFEEMKRGVFIFQFEDTFFYEAVVFILFKQLYNELYNRKEKETFLFLDETQKYLTSSLILKELIRLLQEKRQFGFRLFYTGLTYTDIKPLWAYTNRAILNDINDIYLRNQLLNIGLEGELNKPKEKVLLETNFSNYRKFNFKPFLFEA